MVVINLIGQKLPEFHPINLIYLFNQYRKYTKCIILCFMKCEFKQADVMLTLSRFLQSFADNIEQLLQTTFS